MVSKSTLKQRRKRLLVLADFLEKVVKPTLNGRKFNMKTWGHSGRIAQRVRGFLGVGVVRVVYEGPPERFEQTAECGFVGCAAGWAYYCPALAKAGIRQAFLAPSINGERAPNLSKLSEFFGFDNYADYDHGQFSRCFMPARRGANTGAKGIDLAVARLREVASRDIDD